jgi:hypothetical protein
MTDTRLFANTQSDFILDLDGRAWRHQGTRIGPAAITRFSCVIAALLALVRQPTPEEGA